MGRLAIAELSAGSAFGDLRREWDDLLARAPAARIFDTWEWRATWWRHYGAGRRLRLLAARDAQGTLVGLWPLFEEPMGSGPLAARRWRQVGNGATGADYVDLIAARGSEEEVRSATLAHLGARRGAWDRLDLEDLSSVSPTVHALALRFGAAVRPRFACPYLALDGSFGDYLSASPRRDNYRRRLAWLSRLPGFALSCASAPRETPQALETFLDLHRRRWAADGGSQGVGPREEQFHREVAPLLAARGWLRMYELWADGRVLASVYGIERAGVFSYYQSGLDPDWARRSAGLVLLGLVLEDCFRRGVREFDFLRGSEPYKMEWARARRETVAIRVTAWTVASALLAARERGSTAVRAALKSALPPPLVERARRGLRRVRAWRAP